MSDMAAMEAPTSLTERLILRCFRSDDLDALATIYADTQVARFLSAGVRT
jgi:RimJ/RimL family protein N-acetyltransferase